MRGNDAKPVGHVTLGTSPIRSQARRAHTRSHEDLPGLYLASLPSLLIAQIHSFLTLSFSSLIFGIDFFPHVISALHAR